MKNIILKLSLIVALGFSYSFSSTGNNNIISNEVNIENSTCKHGQCNATAQSTGNRCKHCVSNSGDSYCWQHK
jgi:hypothetical protein